MTRIDFFTYLYSNKTNNLKTMQDYTHIFELPFATLVVEFYLETQNYYCSAGHTQEINLVIDDIALINEHGDGYPVENLTIFGISEQDLIDSAL